MSFSREVKPQRIKEFLFILKVQIFFRLLDNGRLTLNEICRDISMDWRIQFETHTNHSFNAEIERLLFTEMIKEGEDYLPFLIKGDSRPNEDVTWQINLDAYEKIIHDLANIVVTNYHKDISRIDEDGYLVQYLGPYEITTHVINSHIKYFLEEEIEKYNLYL